MRRAMWLAAAVIGLCELPSAAQADSWYTPKPAAHVYYVGRHRCSYGYNTHAPYTLGSSISGYGTYGLKVRGGYGRNGYAPVHGPVWGTSAFAPSYEMGNVPRPYGSYVRPLYPPDYGPAPEALPAADADVAVEADVVVPLPGAPAPPAPPALPK